MCVCVWLSGMQYFNKIQSDMDDYLHATENDGCNQ